MFQPLERTFFPRSATLLLLQVCRLLARGRPSNWGIMLDSGGLGVRTIEILLDKRVLFKLTPLKKPKSLFTALYTPEIPPLKQRPSPQTALNLSSPRLLQRNPSSEPPRCVWGRFGDKVLGIGVWGLGSLSHGSCSGDNEPQEPHMLKPDALNLFFAAGVSSPVPQALAPVTLKL